MRSLGQYLFLMRTDTSLSSFLYTIEPDTRQHRRISLNYTTVQVRNYDILQYNQYNISIVLFTERKAKKPEMSHVPRYRSQKFFKFFFIIYIPRFLRFFFRFQIPFSKLDIYFVHFSKGKRLYDFSILKISDQTIMLSIVFYGFSVCDCNFFRNLGDYFFGTIYMDDVFVHLDDVFVHLDDDFVHLDDVHVHLDDDFVHLDDEKVYLDDKKVYLDDEKVYLDDKKVYLDDKKVYLDDEKVYLGIFGFFKFFFIIYIQRFLRFFFRFQIPF